MALDSASSTERIQAVNTLFEAKDSPGVHQVLVEALKHPVGDVRQGAAQVLGKIGDTSAVPALTEALHDPNDDVREAVVEALGQIGDASAVPALAEMLSNADSIEKSTIIRALGQIGDASAVSVLCQALAASLENSYVGAEGWWMIETLGQIGDASAVPLLSEVLHKMEQSTNSRQRVIEALGKIEDPRVVTILRQVSLKDPENVLRQMAVWVLKQIDVRSRKSSLHG